MPRHFEKTQSASSLTSEQKAIAKTLLWRLKKQEKLNGYSVTSTTIIKKYAEERIRLTGDVVRALVHHIVVDLGEPIASGSDGYRWTEDISILRKTCEHLKDREDSIREKRHGLESIITKLSSTQMEFRSTDAPQGTNGDSSESGIREA